MSAAAAQTPLISIFNPLAWVESFSEGVQELADHVKNVFTPKFLLKAAFLAATLSVPTFMILGAIDLHIWHYLDGGKQLFGALTPYLFDNAIMDTLSNAMAWLAEQIPGGGLTEQIASTGDAVVDTPMGVASIAAGT